MGCKVTCWESLRARVKGEVEGGGELGEWLRGAGLGACVLYLAACV